jgi:hypothetical protein
VFLEYPPIPTVAFLPIFLALYLPPTHIVDTNHITYTLVLPSIIRVSLQCHSPLLGIRGSIQVYTALMCHAIYFLKKKFKRSSVLIEKAYAGWRPRRFSVQFEIMLTHPDPFGPVSVLSSRPAATVQLCTTLTVTHLLCSLFRQQVSFTGPFGHIGNVSS